MEIWEKVVVRDVKERIAIIARKTEDRLRKEPKVAAMRTIWSILDEDVAR